MPLIVYWGHDDFQIELAVKKLKNSILDPTWAGLNYKRLVDPQLYELVETLQTKPMIFGNFLIEVQTPLLFTKKTKKKDLSILKKETIEEFKESFDSIANNTYVLMNCAHSDTTASTLDKTNELTKILLKKTTEEKEFPLFKYYQEDKIVAWLQTYAKQHTINVETDALKLLVENLGTDLRTLVSELQKVATYAGIDQKVKKEHLAILIDRNQDIYCLIDNWITGRSGNTFLELQKILNQDSPLKILATLQSNIGNLTAAKLSQNAGKTPDTIARELGMNQWILTKNLQKFKKVSPDRLLHLKKQILTVEKKIKTGQIDPVTAMEVLLTQ